MLKCGSTPAGPGSLLATALALVALGVGPSFPISPPAALAVGPEECPNAQLRFEDNSLFLPDCRAYELVSPADKNGGSVQGFGANSGGGVLQASAAGEAATFSSAASFGTGAVGAPVASQYLSHRTEAGWATVNITGPTLSGAYGNAETGVPYQLFSADLAEGLLLNGRRCRGSAGECPVANPPLPGSGAPPGYQTYYLRNDTTGASQSVLTQADLAHTALTSAQFSLGLAGATPGLAHVVLSTCAALTANATEVAAAGGCDPKAQNLYAWGGGGLTLLNLLPAESSGTAGAELAAQSGAISASAARVYWSAPDGDLYLNEADHGKAVDESGHAVFQTASSDGSIAFFLKAGHLYRYEASAEAAADLTPSGGVTGVLGASSDGSHLYYSTATAIFLWNAGTITEVAPGPADPSDFPPTTGTSRVTPDGAHLAFLSKAPLAGSDNTDKGTGEPDSEVYLYDAGAGGTLICVSCNPTAGRPEGPSTIPGAIANGKAKAATEGEIVTQAYKPRDLSEGGRRLFFDSSDAIVPTDASTAQDVYQWEAPGTGSCAPGSPDFFASAAGCLFLISSGSSSEASSFIDASSEGHDAFFLTTQSLIEADPGSADLYDAREGGGFPLPEPQIPCEGDSCQSVPSSPQDPSPGTLVPGSSNPSVHFPKVRCGTGFTRKHGKCAKKPHHGKHSDHRGGRK